MQAEGKPQATAPTSCTLSRHLATPSSPSPPPGRQTAAAETCGYRLPPTRCGAAQTAPCARPERGGGRVQRQQQCEDHEKRWHSHHAGHIARNTQQRKTHWQSRSSPAAGCPALCVNIWAAAKLLKTGSQCRPFSLTRSASCVRRSLERVVMSCTLRAPCMAQPQQAQHAVRYGRRAYSCWNAACQQ